MPFTPEANLSTISHLFQESILFNDSLNKFLGLDIVHAMNTRNTITVTYQSQ